MISSVLFKLYAISSLLDFVLNKDFLLHSQALNRFGDKYAICLRCRYVGQIPWSLNIRLLRIPDEGKPNKALFLLLIIKQKNKLKKFLNERQQ